MHFLFLWCVFQMSGLTFKVSMDLSKSSFICCWVLWLVSCNNHCSGLRKLPTQPLGKYLSFLEASIAFEGIGRPRGFRRFRKTHLENILPRGSRDRDPRYPKGVPWDQKIFLKKFFSKSYLGICRQVWGLLLVKSYFWPKNGYLWL